MFLKILRSQNHIIRCYLLFLYSLFNMSDKSRLHFKQQIFEACKQAIEKRMDAAGQAMKAAQESANSEEKSSAGDKYETGRAMSQIDRDRYAKQFREAKNELNQLMRLDITHRHNTAETGAIIVCGEETYFIAAAVGAIVLEKRKVFVLSPTSPLAKLFNGKFPKEKITLNGKTLVIQDIF